MHGNCISGLVHLCFFITLCLLTLTFKVAGTNLPPSCKFNVSQNGHTRQFDLSSLSKQGVWQAQVNSSTYVLVSMCGHLDAANADKCPDTGAAVCLTSRAGGNWTPLVPNAGRTPLVGNTLNESSNDFSINFVGGQMCKDSKNFSTTIFFTCSQAEELVYLSTAQDECTLVLFWSTMAACVSNQEAVDSCVLRSGAGSFDLRPLHRPAGYAVRSAAGHQFELGLCMAGPGGRCLNGSVAACEVSGGSRELLGLFGKHLLEYSPGGGLKLVYKTDHSGSHKKTEISLTCNYSAMTVAPVFLGAEDNVYKFEIETWAACVQWPVECHTYDTQGNKYDLKDLQKHVGNWEIPGDETGKKFVINVCAAVNLDASHKMKGAGAAACSTNATGSRLCSSLGTLSTGPVKADQGPLVLHYTGGSPCHNGSLRYKTEISFVCARFEKGPEFLSKSNDCVYSFLWETPSACPIKYAVGKQCVVTEPTYNTHFDLRPLHNTRQDYSVHLDDGSFSLNVCGPLKEPCGGFRNASVCLRTGNKEIPIGWASDSLHYVDGRVAFELHGAECKPGNKSTVHIIMLCDYSVESVAEPVEYLSTLCTFFFVWHSRETCFPSREVDCRATDENGTVYDLSPLSLASSNHVFLHRDAAGRSKFTINVCRSVVVGYGTVCSPGSAVCMENVSQPGSHNNLVNVGEVTDPPKFENGLLVLRYMGGDICRDSGPPVMSSSIVFVCDPSAVETSPVLEKIKNCHYSFSWRTDVACPQRKQQEPIPEDRQAAQASDCIAVNPATKFRFDLSPLKNIIYTTYLSVVDYLLRFAEKVLGCARSVGAGRCRWAPATAACRTMACCT
ncbi:cation-independent mannose-6-phosphate receptor isoform X2 [Bacillus rossius redtenbacheri]|uniref:cation-independent mannose-6-phosphate receptor isoform X2 n=1 Tax=Bacillus rossius redtenbacheri TaxID=93214 RepID=UPI002FDD3325